MDKKQNAAETVYRLSVVVLDTLFGLLESENMLWKKEL